MCHGGVTAPGRLDTMAAMLLAFEPMTRPVALIGCDELAPRIEAVLRGWRYRQIAAAAAGPPVITIRRTSGGYRLKSSWRPSGVVYRNQVDALCSFIVDLIKSSVAADPSQLCHLHAAAAEFAGRLVVFPSRYQAGKSLLSAHLAAAGVRVWADDVLPIRRHANGAVAPGVLPRLRRPLPDNITAGFRDYVQRHSGLCNRRYLYLEVAAAGLAEKGEEAPVGAFVLLRREAGARPELAPVTGSQMLKRVILQNFAGEVPASDVLERLHGLVEDAQCFRLRYDAADEAAGLLRRKFKAWPARRRARAPEGAARASAGGQAERGVAAGDLRRAPGIHQRRVDDELFLVNPAGDAIYHLNTVGAALWRLLGQPLPLTEAVAVLQQAFPAVPRARIERDVGAIVADLAKRGLIGASEQSR